MLKSFPRETLLQRLPELDLIADVRTQWGALTDNYRLAIHQALDGYREFSISHAPEAGGFVAVKPESARSLPVGFDIEATERVRSVVVKRVMNERDEVPVKVPQSLVWSAKEAAFKSLKGPSQPPVISDIMIFGWKPVTESLWEFCYAPQSRKSGPVINESVGIGLAWLEGTLQFSVCIRTRQ